jgi:zinc ribbon protein/Sel1 repeat-containing protein
VRCARCGNENSDANRFCGMCGATLLATPSAVPFVPAPGAASRPNAVAPKGSSAPAQPQVPAAPRASTPTPEGAPISGPSFLGLNDPPLKDRPLKDPAPSPRRPGSLSIDPQSAPSSNSLDYLLEDDEDQPRSSGTGKFVLILLALALAVGMGYLRWRDHGFGWLGSDSGKRPAAQASDSTDSSSTTPAPANSTNAPAASAAAPPAATDSAPPAGAPASATSASATPASATPAPSLPAAAPVTSSTTTPANAPPASPAPATGDAPAATTTATSTAATPQPSAKDAARDTAPPANSKPSAAATEPLSKPHAAVRPAPLFEELSEAQKYVYGKGVAQNCDHGLRLLKPAADQGNPKAMVEMGALYSAGLCTPRDLPTAYRWFALALRKDPDNQAVQTDLEKLWGEMTQPERQLAIKLSQ